jgi:hypothetical protein
MFNDPLEYSVIPSAECILATVRGLFGDCVDRRESAHNLTCRRRRDADTAAAHSCAVYRASLNNGGPSAPHYHRGRRDPILVA